MLTIVGIFIFISKDNFTLSLDEHEKSFTTAGPVLSFFQVVLTSAIFILLNIAEHENGSANKC